MEIPEPEKGPWHSVEFNWVSLLGGKVLGQKEKANLPLPVLQLIKQEAGLLMWSWILSCSRNSEFY